MKKYNLNLLWDFVKSQPQSPSHNIEHLERVVGFARELHNIRGGDLEIITAAAILHDIGRKDAKLESAASALVAASIAQNVLETTNFPKEKIGIVCSAIGEHDQPELEPTSIEGKILKEADFLAGFGAWGVLRTAMFQGERGKSVDDVLYRFREKMRARSDSLLFPESRLFALKEYAFVKLFLSLLEESPTLARQFPGFYIAFEGISGSGKDTQILKLRDFIRKDIGKEEIEVSEPSEEYRPLVRKSSLKEEQLYLLLADRQNRAKNIIVPALREGKFVISSRCYMSSLVYQVSQEMTKEYIHFLHRELPSPDLVILLDLPGEVAYERILSRGKPLGKNEYIEKLERDRQKYLNSAKDFRDVLVIDGFLSEERISEIIRLKILSLTNGSDHENAPGFAA